VLSVLSIGEDIFVCVFPGNIEGASLGIGQIEELKALYKAEHDPDKDRKFGIPDDMEKSSKWISNVEELIERRGL